MKLSFKPNRNIRLKERGDTIIEVLIAIAVVSSVLGITYSIMNRNIMTVRDNQERSEASKIAQGQLEILKTVWETNPGSLGGGNFCLNPAGVSSTVQSNVEQLDADIYGVCIEGFYHYHLYRNADGGYTVAVKWDKLGGGRSEIVMAYRLQ